MGDTAEDPVDHARTTRQNAGESMKNGYNAPGLILVGLGVVSVFVALFGFATRHASVGIGVAVLAALLFVGGLGWVLLVHRRVRQRHGEWLRAHPGADPQPGS